MAWEKTLIPMLHANEAEGGMTLDMQLQGRRWSSKSRLRKTSLSKLISGNPLIRSDMARKFRVLIFFTCRPLARHYSPRRLLKPHSPSFPSHRTPRPSKLIGWCGGSGTKSCSSAFAFYACSETLCPQSRRRRRTEPKGTMPPRSSVFQRGVCRSRALGWHWERATDCTGMALAAAAVATG